MTPSHSSSQQGSPHPRDYRAAVNSRPLLLLLLGSIAFVIFFGLLSTSRLPSSEQGPSSFLGGNDEDDDDWEQADKTNIKEQDDHGASYSSSSSSSTFASSPSSTTTTSSSSFSSTKSTKTTTTTTSSYTTSTTTSSSSTSTTRSSTSRIQAPIGPTSSLSGFPKWNPRVVWMLWHSGPNNAPQGKKFCFQSWVSKNPDYEIRFLNITIAEALIERKRYYPDFGWNQAEMAAKSDIIRVELMRRYGGIWADATVYCERPLSAWLESKMGLSDIFLYQRNLSNAASEMLPKPFISSWFLVNRGPNSYFFSRLVDFVRKEWSSTGFTPFQTRGYFWLHSMVHDLYYQDPKFKEAFDNIPVDYSEDSHCVVKALPPATTDVFKTTAQFCAPVFQGRIAEFERQNSNRDPVRFKLYKELRNL